VALTTVKVYTRLKAIEAVEVAEAVVQAVITDTVPVRLIP
jgi:hypothetical protein